MPGVILSQFEIQIMASATCACTIKLRCPQ
jgi:hypothetical protein